MYVVRLAFRAHVFGPDAGLYLSDMRFAQVEHTQSGLADTAADRQGQSVSHQAFVEVEFQTFFFTFLFELTLEGFFVYADTH